ncbi:MAG: hypothetical protein JNJ71_17055 [Rubrivivax sp.]|nr:hypothetical protein [Rubrivivax sp.]
MAHSVELVPKVNFLTFGDGSCAYRFAARRLAAQAISTKVFNLVEYYTLFGLRRELPESWRQHRAFITSPSNRRGLGYWLWKVMLIQHKLSKLDDGNILVYCDAGCELNPRLANEFTKALPSLNEDLTVFRGVFDDNVWRVCQWTNGYTISKLDPENEFLNKPQIAAGVLFIKACPATKKLTSEWLRLALLDEYSMLVDRKGEYETPQFKDHRHDQAILSILIYRLHSAAALAPKFLSAQLIESPNGFFVSARRNSGAGQQGAEGRYSSMQRRALVVAKTIIAKLCARFLIDQVYMIFIRWR